MDIILIPGLWLDASSWSAVLPHLEEAGHRPRPLTLPGLEAADADRSEVTLAGHVDAVVAAIDACPGDGRVALVGHSLGSAIAFAALDRRVDRVAHVVFVGGWPGPVGQPIAEGFATDGADLPMPDLSDFDDSDLAGLDEAALTDFRARAVPSPASLTTDVPQLTDPRRYDVPATLVCPEFTAADLQGWLDSGAAPVSELPKLRDLEFVDLPTGHWPQFSRPVDLARTISRAVTSR